MTLSTRDNMKLVRREEKVARLEAFATRNLPIDITERAAADLALTVIAKSTDSPVVQALQAITARFPLLTPHVRVVLVQAATAICEPAGDMPGTVRHAKAQGLGDLHEQFVVSPEAAWIGDAIRRDPERLDSYEAFLEDGSEAIGWAGRAFDRIWAASEPRRAYRPAALDHPAFGAGAAPASGDTPLDRGRH